MRGVLTACSLQRDGARRKTGRSSAASQRGAGFISGESTSWKSVWSSAWSVFLSLFSHTDGGGFRSELTYLSWTMNALKKFQDSTGVWIITEETQRADVCSVLLYIRTAASAWLLKRISTSTCCFTASPSVLQEWTDTWKRFFHLTNSLISQNLSRITFKCPLSSFLFSSLLPFQHLWFKSIDKFKVEKKSKNPRALRTQTGSSIHPLKSL